MSFNYASTLREELKAIAWDLVVIDEAHKLRNAYRPSNKSRPGHPVGHRGLPEAAADGHAAAELAARTLRPVDAHRRALFGDVNSFRSQYASAGSNINDLRQRLSGFCKRTLRNAGRRSTSATPSGGPSPDRSTPDRRRARALRGRLRFLQRRTATPSRSASAT